MVDKEQLALEGGLVDFTYTILHEYEQIKEPYDDNEALLYFTYGFLQGKGLLDEGLVPSEFAELVYKGKEAARPNFLVKDKQSTPEIAKVAGLAAKLNTNKPSISGLKQAKGFGQSLNKLKSIKSKLK